MPRMPDREDEQPTKRIRLEGPEDVQEFAEWESDRPGLLTLSDDVLLMIFSRLRPQDLLTLSRCCRRLEEVTKDRTLWEVVDFRPKVLTLINLKKYIRFFQPGTKFIATKGPASGTTSANANLIDGIAYPAAAAAPAAAPAAAAAAAVAAPAADADLLDGTVNPATPAVAAKQSYHPSISKSFLRGVVRNAPNITTLILENHIIDSSKLLLEDFPKSLQELRLRRCVLTNLHPEKSYFHKMDKSLPKLKILDITDSDWFMPHSLLALSKCQTLEELVLTGCDVCDCLPYTSLAANFGFSALRVLDLRFTFVSDTEVSCFNRTTTLRELLLDAPRDSGAAPQGGGQNDLPLPEVTDFSITTYGGGGNGRGGGAGVGGRVGAPHRLWGPGVRGQNPEWNIHNEGVVIIEVSAYPRPVCRLETLVVRRYLGVTDTSLAHIADHMAYLRYLDVTGSGVTSAGIARFKKRRPEVRVIPDVQLEIS